MARARIGRGEIDTRHHGETHIDAVRRFMLALLTCCPRFFDDLRKLAGPLSRCRLGHGRPLAGFLSRFNLAAAWDPEHPRGFPLRYAVVELAQGCLKIPDAPWPELIARVGGEREARLEVELSLAHEGRQRKLYATAVAAAKERLLTEDERSSDDAQRRTAALQLATEILEALEHLFDWTHHEQIAAFFPDAHELLDVPVPARWCFPRHRNRADPLAPLEGNPLLETREQFEARALQHWEARRGAALELGFPETPVKAEDVHWGWLARYQVDGESYESIALHANCPGGDQRTTPHAIRKGVSAAAQLLNLEVRKAKMGRPPGRRSSSKRLRV